MAARKLGIPVHEDINDPLLPTLGCTKAHYTMDASGHRHSTYRAFLPRDYVTAHEGNLHICTETFARKVQFENAPDGIPRATGVQLQSKSSPFKTVFIGAKREVILACGALRTPQLLMLR